MTKVTRLDKEEDGIDKSSVEVQQGDYVKLDSYDKLWYRYVKKGGTNRTLVSVESGNVWNSCKTVSEPVTFVSVIEDTFDIKVLAVAKSDDTKLEIDEAQEL